MLRSHAVVIYQFIRGPDGLPCLVRLVEAKKKPQVGCPGASSQPVTGAANSGSFQWTGGDTLTLGGQDI
jgi:hypothetical protein